MTLADTEPVIDQASTQYSNESLGKVATKANPASLPAGLLEATKSGYSDSLHSFFLKPQRLSSIDWNSQPAGTVLSVNSIPENILTFAMNVQKTKGFLGFKATAVIKLQVNANKFQAGRLLCIFNPQAQVPGMFGGQRLRSLTAMTQLPRVELDLSTETEVTMEIPYISPTPYYNLTDGTGPMGKVYVVVYSPLATGLGSTSADITVWGSFKDVELVTPTFVAQSGRMRKIKNNTEAELAGSNGKPLSTGLRMASSIAASFAEIPSLKAVCAPASWVLNSMAGLASAFGYSKPLSEVPVTKVRTMGNYNFSNFNGTDLVPNLALDATNKKTMLPFAGTTIDEMSINYFSSIPAFTNVLQWQTDTPITAALYSIRTEPQNFATVGTSGALYDSYDATPMAWITSFFNYWRGSIKVTLKFVKTQFHSGRLAIVYAPGASANPSADDAAFCFREIIDVRDSNEYSFLIPYTSNKQYHKTRDNLTLTNTDPTGLFGIYVVNQLVAPDTVANYVRIIVEVSAGPDFELAFPKTTAFASCMRSSWEGQSGEPDQTSHPEQSSLGDTTVGTAVISPPTLHAAEYCMGEKANSILQLMKRYSAWRSNNDSTAATSNKFVRPYITGYQDDFTLTNNSIQGDYLSFFQACYAYAVGSVRVGFYNRGLFTNNNSPAIIGLRQALNPGFINTGSTALGQTTSCYVNSDTIGQFPCVQIPSYQSLHCRLNRPSFVSGLGDPLDRYTSDVTVGINFPDAANTGVPTILFRAAADDYALGYFVGVPLLIQPKPMALIVDESAEVLAIEAN